MNRSQFYATAADELESGDLTEAIDEAIGAVESDESSEFAIEAGRVTLSAEDE